MLLTACFGQLLYAQGSKAEEAKWTEVERVLNTVINSPQFDSVYNSKKVYFEANELLTKETPVKLKKGKCDVQIIENGSTIKQYVVLGDFTTDWNNMTAVRVQLEIMPQDTMLTLRLEKINGEWQITAYNIQGG